MSQPVTDLGRHYREQVVAHGDSALGTQMSREGQRFRFLKLLEIADLNGCTVLDVGSGLGDLYPFVRDRFPRAQYSGIDIVAEMVGRASEKYPEVSFRQHNLLIDPVPERYDYVLLSAVFNNAISEPTDFLQDLIEPAFALCRRGLGFNFLSTHVNFSEPTMAYHDPARVLDFCMSRLSRRVRLEHHYERCDVAVFVYR